MSNLSTIPVISAHPCALTKTGNHPVSLVEPNGIEPLTSTLPALPTVLCGADIGWFAPP